MSSENKSRFPIWKMENCTQEEGQNIKPIDGSSVHKICSGQVVLTLATAIKELVENSIDAGASIIEVRLKEYGSELLEVIDNGKGVKECDFQNLTLKHHTSKIQDFSDLMLVSTFGFRGEALSSLCALSDMEIVTRHTGTDVGTRLTFDHNGKLIESSVTHRQVGTSVTLKNLFATLPVRQKEFERNLRREYTKAIQLLTAYCLISTKKKIICTNITDKGKRKSTVLSTNGASCMKENIIAVYGSKQVKSLLELVQLPPSESTLGEYFLSSSSVEKSDMFKLEGYVTTSTHGEGRSTTDRQFFYVNDRPCDLPKVAKLVNEVYHSFNRHQYPFFLLNIKMNKGLADVNVTPDKRQIFMPEDKLLLAIIKTSLYSMFEKQPCQVGSCSIQLKQNASISPLSQYRHNNPVSFKRPYELTNAVENKNCSVEKSNKNQKTLDDFVNDSSCTDIEQDDETLNVQVQFSHISKTIRSPVKGCSPTKRCLATFKSKNLPTDINFIQKVPFKEDKFIKKLPQSRSISANLRRILNSALYNKGHSSNAELVCNDAVSQEDLCDNNTENESEIETVNVCSRTDSSVYDTTPQIQINKDISITVSSQPVEAPSVIDEPMSRRRKYVACTFDVEAIQKQLQVIDEDTEKCHYRKFRTKIDPTENQNAENELQKELSKADFHQMEIIGQFNLGFIIVKLNSDLFIIDQHATDEKYNFEILRQDTILDTQKLLNPLDLNLPVAAKTTLMDNLHIFEKNGFKFCINDEGQNGDRIQLVSVPVSQNWSFGKEDIDELIFMLTDNPVKMVRPSRISQMFASRACRKSVMIGTALSRQTMKKLVMHMGEIEQPWNCPHGRPTIRHLFNLDLAL